MKSLLKQLQLSKNSEKRKSGTYGTGKAWNSGTCGTGEWEKKEDKCEFYENRMHIAQKHKIKIVKILKMTKKILMIC